MNRVGSAALMLASLLALPPLIEGCARQPGETWEAPSRVEHAVDNRYPNAVIEEVDYDDAEDAYRVDIETAEGRGIELEITPDGRITGVRGA